MSTITTYVTDVHTILGTAPRNSVAAMVGEFADGFDMDALEAGYIDYIAGFLPDGYSISGRSIYRNHGSTGPLNVDEIRDMIDDDPDGFDLSQYATDTDTDPVRPVVTITMRTIGQASRVDPVVYIADETDPWGQRLVMTADQYNALGKPATITVNVTTQD